ncbi:hypothetical protein GUJ93_ZPchr0007g5004 [Zizania palustris]|uniref:Uncharacterized protein n=1 Tax=Zizania palustris TaxID=103762 RepID=A0A8J5TDH6_ZIZPA|nr:hypothetical protein GUJ93_ZPchr0007g5004 [Zizania palustris]
MPKGKSQGASPGSEIMPPKIQGKQRSALPRGRNCTPWLPIEGLLNSVKKMNKFVKDQSAVDSEAIKMGPKSTENNAEDAKDTLLAVRTDITERIDPKKRGKRSVRPRGHEPAPWASLHRELPSFQTDECNPAGGDQDVFSGKMKPAAEGDKNSGSRDDVPKVGASAKVKSTTSDVPAPDASVKLKDSSKHAGAGADADDADAVEQKDVLMIAGADVTGSSAPQHAAAQVVTGAIYPIKVKTENVTFDTAASSALDGGIRHGGTFYGSSGAEAALAAIYGREPSGWDMCVAFAVKLLKDEAQLPEDAAQVEEFFRQKMDSTGSSTDIAGPSEP